MSTCSIEAGHRKLDWETELFWQLLHNAPVHDCGDGQFQTKVTRFMVESGICVYMKQEVERYRAQHPPPDGSTTPTGIHIEQIMAETGLDENGQRRYGITVLYPVSTNDEVSITEHTTDLYYWTEPGILPDYKQVTVLQELEYKLHEKAHEYDALTDRLSG